jgi:hypothetical protein
VVIEVLFSTFLNYVRQKLKNMSLVAKSFDALSSLVGHLSVKKSAGKTPKTKGLKLMRPNKEIPVCQWFNNRNFNQTFKLVWHGKDLKLVKVNRFLWERQVDPCIAFMYADQKGRISPIFDVIQRKKWWENDGVWKCIKSTDGLGVEDVLVVSKEEVIEKFKSFVMSDLDEVVWEINPPQI